MKKKNLYLIVAGILNLLTALLHTIGGQIDLVSPLLESNLTVQARSEWMGVWHVITIMLFASSFYFLKLGYSKTKNLDFSTTKFLGILYCLMAVPFILSSIYFKTLAPQWIILLPIGVLTLVGIKKAKHLTA